MNALIAARQSKTGIHLNWRDGPFCLQAISGLFIDFRIVFSPVMTIRQRSFNQFSVGYFLLNMFSFTKRKIRPHVYMRSAKSEGVKITERMENEEMLNSESSDSLVSYLSDADARNTESPFGSRM